jgi:hypothetical protein
MGRFILERLHMTAKIQWSNPIQQGNTRSIDAFYQGAALLESFDLSLMFPPGQAGAKSLKDEAAGWTVFSNTAEDGNFLVAGILNPGQVFKSDQKLFTLVFDSTSKPSDSLSFLYSANLNALSQAPISYVFSGTAETVLERTLIPLESSKFPAGWVNASLDKKEGTITSMSDVIPSVMGLKSFETVTTPIDLKISLVPAVSEASVRLHVNDLYLNKGFWSKNTAGQWLNLLSDAQGGKTSGSTLEPNQGFFEFGVEDGGQLDADGQINGVVSLVGVIGDIDLQLTGKSSDLPAAGGWL